MTTTSRLLSVLSLLQARRDWPGALLAERLGVSHRTVRRDIERLRELGYRIQATMGPDGGYRLDAGSELPPLLLDDEQVVAVTVALQAAALTGAGVGEAALRALTTLRQVLPARLRRAVDAVDFTTLQHPDEASVMPVSPEVLVALSAAVRSREVLRFDYASRALTHVGTPGTPRRVEPHHVLASRGRWFLVAWDLDRADWRFFRVDRIDPRTPTGPRFASREVPGGDPQAYVAARFAGTDVEALGAGSIWPCTGTVVLHLPADDVRPFAGDGVVEPLGPDRCRFTAGSWSWVALAASLGRFDTDVDVVSPPELVDAFAVLAARTAATAVGHGDRR